MSVVLIFFKRPSNGFKSVFDYCSGFDVCSTEKFKRCFGCDRLTCFD